MKVFWSSIFIFLTLTTKAQSLNDRKIYIGQKAEEVEKIVTNEVQGHYDSQSYLTKVSAEEKFANKQLREIIECKENVLVREPQKSIDFCTHYHVANGVISFISTDYKNLSKSELIASTAFNCTNVNGYFIENIKEPSYYLKINQKADTLVVLEYHLTKIDPLPISIIEQFKIIKN